MSAATQLRLDIPEQRNAQQTQLHPELNRAHVRFVGLGKTYNGQQGPVAALHGIDLAIQRGEVFGIIGRSGAGKSSLIRTINRLEQPSSGRVLIDQVDIGEFDEDRLVALRRRIGMIFQHFNLMSAKTVWQNVELPLKVAGVPKEKRERKVRELLELVGLEGKHKAYPAQLSGGRNSESASPGHWCTTRRFCCATKPPRHWTRRPPNRSSACCARSISAWA